jgi:hypothetical protein
MARKIFLCAVLALAACTAGVCARHSDCGHDQVCSRGGLCVTAPDGGSTSEPDNDGGIDAATDDAAPDGGS